MHWGAGLNGLPGATALPGGQAYPGNGIMPKTFIRYYV